MTRKHFEAIAAAMAQELELHSPHSPRMLNRRLGVRGCIHSLADYFASENPRFDRRRFFLAAGLTHDGFLPGPIGDNSDPFLVETGLVVGPVQAEPYASEDAWERNQIP